MRFLGRLVGKTEVAKENIKDEINTRIDNTKQNWSDFKQRTSERYDSAKEKTRTFANNVAHPIDYSKRSFEEGRAEALRERERERELIEERFARELESEKRKIQSASSNREKMLGAAAIVAPEAGPAIGMAEEKMHEKDNKKIQKEEEKLMKKEERELDKSSGNDKKFMNRIDDLRQGPSRGSGWMQRGPGILFILAVFAYFFDLFTGFTRPPNYGVILLYGFMIIIAMIMTKVSTNKWVKDSDFMGFVAAIAFTVAYPWVIDVLRENIPYQFLVDLLGPFLLFPPMIMYLMFKYPENSAMHKTAVWIIIALALYAFLVLLNSPTLQGTTVAGKITITKPWDLIKDFGGNVVDAATGAVNNMERSFQIAIAKATGQKYEGEEEEQRGILIENVKAVEKNYYTSSDIYVQGKIKAQNLVGEVNVRTRCYVKNKGNGTTYPEMLTMVTNDENIIDCHLGQLPKGNYQVFVAATFIFITDADIQYYFVDEKTRPELYDKMNIPDKAMATYTGGPVEVGLPSLNLPLRLSADGSNPRVGNYPFGVSLTNKWSQGKVNRGINYTLEVPDGFELKECNRVLTYSGQKSSESGRRWVYTFDTDDQNIKETFDSVTCRMHAVNPSSIFNGDIVAMKTFNARAVYEYTVEGSVSINVQQDYYGG